MTTPVPDPWPDDEPTSIDVHLDRLEQLHRRIEGLLMAENDDAAAATAQAERDRIQADKELAQSLFEALKRSVENQRKDK